MSADDTTDLTLGFKLGGCTVEPLRERIVLAGRTIHLEPKVMQVLVELAKHAQSPVSRDDLLARVWSDTVVGEEVLSRAISLLRSALGDDRTDPKYIRTLPRHGYELIQPVEPLPTIASKQNRRAWVAGAAVVLVALTILLVSWQVRTPSDKVIMLAPLAAKTVELGGTATGLGDALHSLVSTATGVQVVARSWSFALWDPTVRTQGLAAEFDADYVLEGSLTRAGAQIVLTLELIEAANSRSVWHRRFAAQNAELLSELMLREVQTVLNQRLNAGIETVPEPVTPINEQAYKAYLEARHHRSLRGEAHIGRAAELLRRSIELDPDFAEAHLALAQVIALLPFYTDLPLLEQFDRARRQLSLAVNADPLLRNQSQGLEGFMRLRSREWQGAQEILQDTLAADPEDPLAHYWYSMFLGAIGDYVNARIHAQLAVDFEPTSPVLRDRLAIMHLWVGDLQAAQHEFVRAEELGFTMTFKTKAYIVFLSRTEQYDALANLLVNMQLPADWVALFVQALRDPTHSDAAVAATIKAFAAEQIPQELHFGVWVLLQQADQAIAAFDYSFKSADVEFLWAKECAMLQDGAGYEAMLTALNLHENFRKALTKNSLDGS